MYRREEFNKIEMLGGGKSNTKVYKVEHKPTGNIYALKEVEAKDLDKLNEYKEEAFQLSKVQHHPNILKCHGYYFYSTKHKTFKLGIISEYISSDNNLENIYRLREKHRQYWKEEELLKIAYSLIDTLAYLELVGICHRDIKPQNLFLMENLEVKIIDFGESVEWFEENDEEGQKATIRGTPLYLSPILARGHCVLRAKEIEHNMYKSDVFSSGLVIFQLASFKDINGFNLKTDKYDGEKLIREGLKYLNKRYSDTLVDLIRRMLIFNEEDRPTFIQLGKIIATDAYEPKAEKNIFYQMEEIERNNKIKTQNGNSLASGETKDISGIDSKNQIIGKKERELKENLAEPNVDRVKKFYEYVKNNKINANYNKCTYWFEYGGSRCGKYSVNEPNPSQKWKLFLKNKFEFNYHFNLVYVNEKYGYFLIGGRDEGNNYQYKDGEIIQKSSMNCKRSFLMTAVINHYIFAIGGYEFSQKDQVSSIEVYEIEKDSWRKNYIKDLNTPRSSGNSLVFNNESIYVFGGFNKIGGTLNSIEKINLKSKECELVNIFMPAALRRFGLVRISEFKVFILGGLEKHSKNNEEGYILDLQTGKSETFKDLTKGGILEHEIIFDENGYMHIFYESNFGTTPPEHNMIDFLRLMNL